MPIRRSRSAQAMILVLLGPVAMACAASTGGGDAAPHAGSEPVDATRAAGRPVGSGAAALSTVTVPDLNGLDAAGIAKTAARAGVVAIFDYDATATGPAGTVVRMDPAAGTAVPLGSTVNVTLAGAPAGTLDDLVAADQRTFVGLGVDPDGTLVVAVKDGVDVDAALRRIEPALAGRRHRVVRCAASSADLSRIAIELTRRDDLRAGGFVVVPDPAVCAVRVQGDIAPGVSAELKAAYGEAVLVENTGPAQRAPRP
jgi:PASTA domain